MNKERYEDRERMMLEELEGTEEDIFCTYNIEEETDSTFEEDTEEDIFCTKDINSALEKELEDTVRERTKKYEEAKLNKLPLKDGRVLITEVNFDEFEDNFILWKEEDAWNDKRAECWFIMKKKQTPSPLCYEGDIVCVQNKYTKVNLNEASSALLVEEDLFKDKQWNCIAYNWKDIDSVKEIVQTGDITFETMERLLSAPVLLRNILQINKDTGEVVNSYNNQEEAANAVGVKKQRINVCLNGKAKTAGGYVWRYNNK